VVGWDWGVMWVLMEGNSEVCGVVWWGSIEVRWWCVAVVGFLGVFEACVRIWEGVWFVWVGKVGKLA